MLRFFPLKLRKFSKNWSAEESRPPFVARPITGEKFVEDVTLENEMGRRTKGIQTYKTDGTQRNWCRGKTNSEIGGASTQ